MRLINCYIENFGKLSDLSLYFKNGYNEFCYENGWGKSTLAAFIKCMFFGFEGERKHGIANERKFYMPWQGGVFGGQLTFEMNNKKYIISRVFGKKESDDIFEIRDAETNLQCDDYSFDIGKNIFGIDGESFKRSIYISQNDCVTNITGDINAKMGNITDNTEDLNTYDIALDRIKDYLNRNSPTKKTGNIRKLKDKATELENKIKCENVINNAIQDLKQKINVENNNLKITLKKQNDISNQQGAVSAQKEIKSKLDRYEEINSHISTLKKDYEKICESFPGRIPDKEELTYNLRQCNEMNTAYFIAESFSLNKEEIEKLDYLNNRFINGIPTDKEFDIVRNKNIKLCNYRNNITFQLSKEEKDNLEKYKNKFKNDEQVLKKLDTLQDSWIDRVRISDSLKQKQEELNRIDNILTESNLLKKKNIVLMVSGLFLSIIGILVSFKETLPGILLGILGIFIFIISLLKKTNKSELENHDIQIKKNHLKDDITKSREKILSIDKEIEDFFGDLNIPFINEKVQDNLKQLMKEATIYEELNEKDLRMKKNNQLETYKELIDYISEFLANYNIVCEEEIMFNDNINYLEREKDEFLNLSDKKLKWSESNKKYIDKKNEIIKFIHDINFVLEDDIEKQLHNILEEVNDYTNKKSIYYNELQVKEEFEKNNDIDKVIGVKDIHGETDLVQLNGMYESICEEIDTIKDNIQFYKKQYESALDELDELLLSKDELHEINEKIQEELKKYRLIDKTQELLVQAKEKLTSKYIGPLKNSFSNYFHMITNYNADSYYIDANAVITVREFGMQREVSCLSAGYQDLIGLCLRLSFVDAMYEKEKPMIILDDPFVNFDKNKLEAGKKLLKNLESKYQIIYFTCNESR